MAEAQYAHNHQIDQATGFLISPAFDDAFDAEKKLRFLEMFEQSGGLIYKTAERLGMNGHTIQKHMQIDPVFRQMIVDAKQRANESVESVLYQRALDPKGSFDRAMWLNNNYKEKYGESKRSETGITLKIELSDSAIQAIRQRNDQIKQSIDAEVVNSEVVDNQDI